MTIDARVAALDAAIKWCNGAGDVTKTAEEFYEFIVQDPQPTRGRPVSMETIREALGIRESELRLVMGYLHEINDKLALGLDIVE